MEINTTQTTYKCLRCNYVWTPRFTKNPKTCPVCGSPKWNVPRKFNKLWWQLNYRADVREWYCINIIRQTPFIILGSERNLPINFRGVNIKNLGNRPFSFQRGNMFAILNLRIVRSAFHVNLSHKFFLSKTSLYPKFLYSFHKFNITHSWHACNIVLKYCYIRVNKYY